MTKVVVLPHPSGRSTMPICCGCGGRVRHDEHFHWPPPSGFPRSLPARDWCISSHVRDLVLKERRSLLIRDALSEEALAGWHSIVEQRIRSMLAVPLQTEDRVIGLIYLDSPHHIHEFTREDLNLLTVMSNIGMPLLDTLTRFGVVSNRRERQLAQRYVKDLAIRTPNVDQKVMYLSGGNQQRVVISKWLATQPKILIVDEPTRGVDIGAKSELHALLRERVPFLHEDRLMAPDIAAATALVEQGIPKP